MAEETIKNNKKSKSIKIIFLAIILLTLANLFAYPVVAVQAKIYLSLKYKESPTKFELVDHNQSHVRSKEYAVFFTQPVWIDFSFEYKYNDRLFFVNRDKGRFYDDYQLEDIENWSTEWLKENVDERIIGIDLDSDHIRKYQKEFNNRKLTENDTKEFLSYFFLYPYNDYYYCMASFYDESLIQDDDIESEKKKLSNAIIKKLKIIGMTHTNIIYLSQKKHKEYEHIKGIDSWTTYYH